MKSFQPKRFFVVKTRFIVIMVCSAVLFSCDSSEEKPPEPHLLKDMVIRISEPDNPELKICYHLDSITSWAEKKAFQEKFKKEELEIIYALNRIDESRVGPGKQLVVPDTLLADLYSYSPFPEQLDFFNDVPKVVLIAQRIQGIALYEKGKLLRWGPVSAGKQSTPTPNGLHYGNYKSRMKISTVDKAWKLPFYFNIMNEFGVGVHQYVLPGYPASHACVRLRMQDAEFIYNWANQWTLGSRGQKLVKNGTPFIVFGKYDYTKPAPWKQLVQDPDNNDLNEAEINALKKYAEEYQNDKNNFSEADNQEEVVAVR